MTQKKVFVARFECYVIATSRHEAWMKKEKWAADHPPLWGTGLSESEERAEDFEENDAL